MNEEQKKSCIYNGQPYSHGATICANKSELVCNDGGWEPTGKKCEEAEETQALTGAWGHVSQAVASHAGTYEDKPVQVTIVNGNVEVVLRTFGRGKIVSSMINNSSHTQYLYYGKNQVPPGTYTHRVGDGQGQNFVGYPPSSSIDSLLYHD